jgi:hypothetical protein
VRLRNALELAEKCIASSPDSYRVVRDRNAELDAYAKARLTELEERTLAERRA